MLKDHSTRHWYVQNNTQQIDLIRKTFYYQVLHTIRVLFALLQNAVDLVTIKTISARADPYHHFILCIPLKFSILFSIAHTFREITIIPVSFFKHSLPLRITDLTT